MAQVFPVFGKSGKPIAVCTTQQNAEMVVKKVTDAGGTASTDGEAIPYNPATAKDPSMLAGLVEASLS